MSTPPSRDAEDRFPLRPVDPRASTMESYAVLGSSVRGAESGVPATSWDLPGRRVASSSLVAIGAPGSKSPVARASRRRARARRRSSNGAALLAFFSRRCLFPALSGMSSRVIQPDEHPRHRAEVGHERIGADEDDDVTSTDAGRPPVSGSS